MTDSGEFPLEDEEAEFLEFAESIVIDAIEEDVQVADLQEVITLLERLQAHQDAQEQIAVEQQIRNELKQRAPDIARKAVEQAKLDIMWRSSGADGAV
jgi:hypothetical protein